MKGGGGGGQRQQQQTKAAAAPHADCVAFLATTHRTWQLLPQRVLQVVMSRFFERFARHCCR